MESEAPRRSDPAGLTLDCVTKADAGKRSVCNTNRIYTGGENPRDSLADSLIPGV